MKPEPTEPLGKLEWAAERLGPAVGAVLFAVAVWAIHHELEGFSLRDVWAHVDSLPRTAWIGAIGSVVLSYTALGAYDLVAARHIGIDLPSPKVFLAGILGWAVSNTIGHAWLSGGAIRMRLYGGWGVGPGDVTRIVVFDSMTLWMGFALTAGLALVFDPPAVFDPWGRGLGVLLLLGLAALGVVGARRTRPLEIGGWSFALPPPATFVRQLAVASVDNVAAIGAMWFLLPADAAVSFPQFVVLFVLANLVGVLSGIPGGAGTLDGTLIALLSPMVDPADLLGSVLAWRLLYDLVPLTLAGGVMAVLELRREHERAKRAADLGTQVVSALGPPVLSALAFVSGGVLLWSAATRAESGRLVWLGKVLPLALVETSHAVSAAIGVSLLFVARGLWSRLHEAWVASVVLLAIGAVVSLAKGLDWEEATALGLVLAIALPSRHRFYRRAALSSERLPAGWVVAILAAVGVMVVVFLRTYTHTNVADGLWTRFALSAEAARSLRAAGLVVVAASAGVLGSLLRPARYTPPRPSTADLDDALRITVQAGRTNGWLALLGDKALLFDEARTAFLMFGVVGRHWVAYAGPIGAPDAWQELLWSFREKADLNGARIALYEVPPEVVTLGIELGLAPYKFGEEAVVDLRTFSLEGGENKSRRYALKNLEREGLVFEVIPTEGVVAVLPALRRVSDDWLGGKVGREKGFSLGYFDEAYLCRMPIAVVRRGDEVLAFANVLRSGGELSVDLMRFRSDAPNGTMEVLFLSLMKWGREQGCDRFVLGMAPLGGLPDRDLAPFWARIGTFVFRNGEQFYNFQGLRAYKDKFRPVWQPRYLLVQGGLALPATLAAIARLVSGGAR